MESRAGAAGPVILVVEDDPVAIRLVEEAFDEVERTFSHYVATDGVEAFDFLHRRGAYEDAPTADLIVLDLNLPGKTGRQILEEIKGDADLGLTPVVVFSQIDDPETIADCYRLGANAYITKPADYEEMLEVTQRLTDFWLGTAETPSR